MRPLKAIMTIFVLVSALLVSLAASAISPVYTERGSNIAIKGYDPVAYFKQNKPVKGDESFAYEYNGAKWLFSSEENKQLFASDPEQYSPQYGGYCAYAVSRNMTASIRPELFIINEGKLYLNYNKTVNKRFLKNKDTHIARADRNWPNILKR